MTLVFALLGYFLLAVVVILDKFILTKSVPSPAVYTFYSTIFMVAAFLAWPFGVEWLAHDDLFVATLSGIAFGFGLYCMYVAIKKGEASHIGPFVGSMVAIATFVLAGIFLGEYLTQTQVYGVCVLIAASLVLSYQKTRQPSGPDSFFWGVAAGVFFAISHVSAKFLYEIYPFVTSFVWTRATTALVGVVLLLSPSVRRALKKAFTQRKGKGKRKNSSKTAALVVVDKTLGIVGVVLIQYAIAVGSVTIVNALSGVQFVLLFAMIVILTRCCSRLFSEYFTRRELIVQTVGLLLVVLGTIMTAI
jgi:uncharacterized membrane protein